MNYFRNLVCNILIIVCDLIIWRMDYFRNLVRYILIIVCDLIVWRMNYFRNLVCYILIIVLFMHLVYMTITIATLCRSYIFVQI
jgi:hypothetical protein